MGKREGGESMPPEEKVRDDTTVDVSGKPDASVDNDKGSAGDKDGKAATDAKTADGSGKTPAKLEEVLGKYGLDGAEDLDEFIGNLATLKEKIGSESVEELLANKKELQKIQADIARAEEARRRESETPEETIQRLENQLKQEKGIRQQEAAEKARAVENEKLIKSFNNYVGGAVDGLEGYSKTEQKFLKQFLGVNNPIHDIELTDSAGIKKIIASADKQYKKLREAIIEDFKKNGERSSSSTSAGDLPPTPRMDRAAEPGSNAGEIQPQNMRDARTIAKKQLFEKLIRR
jgi:hypothetical protein